MDTIQSLIIKEALEWQGTKWYAGQSQKDVGCDCVGFLVGVGKNVGFLPTDFKLENYGRVARNDSLLKALNRYLINIKDITTVIPGDVLVFKKMHLITHVGIYIDQTYFIHAHQESGVIKNRVKDFAKLLIAVYRVPDGRSI